MELSLKVLFWFRSCSGLQPELCGERETKGGNKMTHKLVSGNDSPLHRIVIIIIPPQNLSHCGQSQLLNYLLLPHATQNSTNNNTKTIRTQCKRKIFMQNCFIPFFRIFLESLDKYLWALFIILPLLWGIAQAQELRSQASHTLVR